jgi:uncharacterized protein YdeI (YjbR/CyaY-like superfamily)
VWLVWYKKHTGRESIPYEDAVEEALCFGWIDSIVQKLDDERYARKFTPRNPKSAWSPLNKRRALRMLKAGAMKEAGRLRLPPDVLEGSIVDEPPKVQPGVIPPFIRRGLRTSPAASERFKALPPSTQRVYVGWVMTAKKEETRARRLREILSTLAHNRRLGMK